jgi:hypothetical protein
MEDLKSTLANELARIKQLSLNNKDLKEDELCTLLLAALLEEEGQMQ